MPWLPELFTAPALEHILQGRRDDEHATVPYIDGFLAGDPDALVASFADDPLVYDPLRGRVQGTAAFRAFAARTYDWLQEHHVTVEHVIRVAVERGGFGEAVVHLDGHGGRIALPFATITDTRPDRRIEEVRVYHSNQPLAGRHATRPPLFQPDPELRLPKLVAAHQRALAAGDVEAILATFEPDGYAREPAGAERDHLGVDALRAFYERLCSDGGITLEHCAIVGDERAYALEYNAVRWGRARLLPQAGTAVYVPGPSGRLAAVRVYDDVEPPPAATWSPDGAAPSAPTAARP